MEISFKISQKILIYKNNIKKIYFELKFITKIFNETHLAYSAVCKQYLIQSTKYLFSDNICKTLANIFLTN